jgi:hypothetical protein
MSGLLERLQRLRAKCYSASSRNGVGQRRISRYARYFTRDACLLIGYKVSAKLYGILALLAEQCPSFGRSSVALATGHLADKLGDMKLKKPAGDLLLLFAEKTSLHFVLTQG